MNLTFFIDMNLPPAWFREGWITVRITPDAAELIE
jgi:hypothetical protein